MRIVVVGNAPVPWAGQYNRFTQWPSVAKFINKSDLVVRFKRIDNQNKFWSGRKTDILYTRINGEPARKDIRKPSPYTFIERPKKIFTNYDDYRFERPQNYQGEKIPFDYSKIMAKQNKWPPDAIEPLSEEFRQEIRKMMFEISPDFAPATVGFMALVHILYDERFKDFEKYYVGFTFQGWSGHKWDVEKHLVQKWTDEGKLTPLTSQNVRKF